MQHNTKLPFHRQQFVGLGSVAAAPPVAPNVPENTAEIDLILANARKKPTKISGKDWAKVQSHAVATGQMGGALSVHPEIIKIFQEQPHLFPSQETVSSDEITLRPAANGRTIFGTFQFTVSLPSGKSVVQNALVPRGTENQVVNGAPVIIQVEESEQGFRYVATWKTDN